jgi:hypothetical protein
MDDVGIIKYKCGWQFTTEQEELIHQACINAHVYMQTYGKGADIGMVNVAHYENIYPLISFPLRTSDDELAQPETT